MKKIGKIAVIGDKDSVFAFKSLGLDVFGTNNPFEAKDLIRKLDKEEYAIIYITEKLAMEVNEIIEKYNAKAYPVIIPIPDGQGSTGYGIRRLKKDVEKAVGTDIIFNKGK